MSHDSSVFDKKELDETPTIKEVFKWVYGPLLKETLQVNYKPLVSYLWKTTIKSYMYSAFYDPMEREGEEGKTEGDDRRWWICLKLRWTMH